MNDKPLETQSDNPSLNSRLKTATENQSSVKPENYPEEKRVAQKQGSTSGAPRPDEDAPRSKEPRPAQAPAEGSDDLPPPDEGSPKA